MRAGTTARRRRNRPAPRTGIPNPRPELVPDVVEVQAVADRQHPRGQQAVVVEAPRKADVEQRFGRDLHHLPRVLRGHVHVA
jgi:hypothetical protein